MRRSALRLLSTVALLFAAASPAAYAAEDSSAAGPSFKPGDVIPFEKLEELKPFLPKEVWANRDFFFFEGMKLEIGPFYENYAPASVYSEATAKFAGHSKLGPDGSLEGYTSGQPFPIDKIDCKGDPDAGTKMIWDFHYRWAPPSGVSSFYYSYWDRGEELPLYYEGTGGGVELSHRPEPSLLEQGGDMFRGETRKNVSGAEVTAPFDARGIMLLSYRYKESDNAARESAQRRHLGLRADAAPRAPHLDRAAHRRDLRHRLHARRPVLVQRRRAPVRLEVPRRAGRDRAVQYQGEGLPVRQEPELRSLRPLLRQRPLGSSPRRDRADDAAELGASLRVQRHLHRQGNAPAALLVRLTTRSRSCGRSSTTTTAGARTTR